MTARVEATAPGDPFRYDPLWILDGSARDARIKGVALAVAVLLHGIALVVNLPALRWNAPPEPTVRRPTFVRRYVPPPPAATLRATVHKEVKRLLPVPDPTPDAPEPVLEPESEIVFSDPGVAEFGELLGVPEAPPGYEGPGTLGPGVAEPRLAGVGGVTNPVLIAESYVRPDYPEVARLARQEADVVLRAIITREGTVDSAEVLRCTRPAFGFEDAALVAVRRWRYLPATQDGEPVSVYFTILVEFELL